jgi:CheY-like chemotaxis protein/anti-sigma regulatory factor (Ser/Thr protein kinase)
MEKAVEAARDLVQLLHDLVEMPDGEYMPMVNRPFRVDEAMQDVVKLLSARAAGAGIGLAAGVAPGTSPAWRGDIQRLRQILVQLVANGLRATQRGEVRLDARETSAGALELRISDTGRGMAPDRLERLFEPLGGPEGGSSLGLAVCRDLARRMGGDITVKTAPGKGTAFTVTLPLDKATLAAVEDTAAIARPIPMVRRLAMDAARSRAPVLVVDDVSVNRRLLATVLARAGFAHEEAGDGETALALLAARDFSAVLMDVEMPGMDGMETTRRLRAMPGKPAILPVIAVTAHRSAEGEEKARAAGMDHYLVKPVGAAELAEALARTTDRGAKAS